MSKINSYIKNFALLVLIFTFFFGGFAQNVLATGEANYEYTLTFGGTGEDRNTGSAVDSDGNVYITGYFYGSNVDLDPTAGEDLYSSFGQNDIFLTKINADGSYGYTKRIGSAGFDQANAIAVDADGNVYLTGNFAANGVDFDPGVGNDNHDASTEGRIFLTKINADGSYGYTKVMGGFASGSNQGLAVATDSSNNVYYAGYFVGTDIDLDPTGGTQLHTSSGDIFLTKLNADGSFGYTKAFTGDFGVTVRSITADSNSNVYMTGTFLTTDTDFNPSGGTDLHTPNGGIDNFLTKINADGSYGYTYTIGGTGYDLSGVVAVDSFDNVYIAGYAVGTDIDFDPTGGTDLRTTGADGDIFLTKINTDSTYGYTKLMTTADYGGETTGIAFDSFDNIFLTGYWYGTNDFDHTGGTDSHTSVDETADIFLTKINADGSYGYTYVAGGYGEERDQDVLVDDLDNVYVSGYFDSVSFDFDPTSGTDTHSRVGSDDIFLTKFSQPITHTLTYTPGTNGTLTGTTPQTVNEGADGTAVTAVPDAGYRFLDWSDASTTNPRTDTAVTGDVTVTANFEFVPVSNSSGSRPSSSFFQHQPTTTSNNNNSNPQPNSNSNSSSGNNKHIFSRNLRLKNAGEDVKELQKYLNTHGFTVANTGNGSAGNESTFFGPRTKAALIKFQLANNLTGDGIVGPMTRGVLSGE